MTAPLTDARQCSRPSEAAFPDPAAEVAFDLAALVRQGLIDVIRGPDGQLCCAPAADSPERRSIDPR